MDAHGGQVGIGFDHGDEFLEGIGVFVQLGHLNHESGEDFLFEHLAADGELALHKRVPLLETVDGLYIGLDIHLAVTDLGIVDIVLGADDVDLIALALPHLLGDGDGKTCHAFVRFAEALTEAAEFEAGLTLLADFKFCHFAKCI